MTECSASSCSTTPIQEGAGPDEVYTVGATASILQMMRVPDGSVRLAIQGSERMKILEWVSEEPFLMAKVLVLDAGCRRFC